MFLLRFVLSATECIVETRFDDRCSGIEGDVLHCDTFCTLRTKRRATLLYRSPRVS
jgi:hypothetical protein